MKLNQIICEFIKTKHTPVNFGEISDLLLSKKLSPNKTTIYRNLEKLAKENYIKKVVLSDQKQYWEINQCSQNHQHYHLICQNCEKIECKEMTNFNLPNDNFQINKAEINFFGICNNCLIS